MPRLIGRGVPDIPWDVAVVPGALIAVVAIAMLGRLSDPGIGAEPTSAISSNPTISSTPSPPAIADGQIPDVLRHSWQRPYAVTPDMEKWPTGFLSLVSGLLDFGPEPGTEASRSAVAAEGFDTLLVTATVETQGCAIRAVGAYRWSVEGKGTVLTLTAIGADDCAVREEALVGGWVRSDLPAPGDGEPALPAGTYLTLAFDPFGNPREPGQLSYTVPQGWKVEDDVSGSFVLHHHPDTPGQPSTDWFVFLLAQPRMAADFEKGASCGVFSDAPGVGRGVDDIVATIVARPGVVSTPPASVIIGGYEGQTLDLHLAPSWTGGCQAPEGPVVGVPILSGAGSETRHSLGLGPDNPLRLILLKLTIGRTMAIAIVNPEPSQASQFEEQVAVVMPIIESLQFHAPTP